MGPAKVLPLENPQISCTFLDINPEDTSIRGFQFIEKALSIFDKQPGLPYITFRNGEFFHQTWTPLHKNKIKTKPQPFRNKGVYLITGGLGGIGLALAEFLSARAAAKLILLGRSPFPPRKKWSCWIHSRHPQDPVSIKIRKILDMEKTGSMITIIRADMTDLDQMQRAVKSMKQRFGGITGRPLFFSRALLRKHGCLGNGPSIASDGKKSRGAGCH